ncbi:MAG: hypothetical protein HOP33_03520 [Verrucomicrobia bacterium]|nr:hypothetical protein [Verrucomicrobiota bacterium]
MATRQASATNSFPQIVQQPLSQAVEVGNTVTLDVTATGSPTPYFQWFKNNAAISNATEATLNFNPVLESDAADYFVMVSNIVGTVISSNAVLAVRPPGAPIISVNGHLVAGSVSKVGSATITMASGYSNGVIYYTLDGSTPDFGSALYTAPIVVSNSVVVRSLGLNVDTFDAAEAPAVAIAIIPTYPLSLGFIGHGTVVADPVSASYASNSVASVTATPDFGWAFDHWSGNATGNANPVNVTMSGPQSVQAVFVQLYPVLASTAGGGSVIVSPTQALYSSNSVVSVSATASNDWTFMQWQGDASGTNNPLNITVGGPKSVSAVFGTTMITSVIGSGAIQMNATNPIAYGMVVSLTATPDSGWLFDHWAGDVSGSDNPVSVTMNGLRSVQAVFVQVVYPLTASTAGGGSVDVSPVQGPYPSGSIVSVSATASNGWTFLQWQGDASGTNNPLSLIVDGPKSVSAVFGTLVGTGVIGSGLIELNATNLVAYGTVTRATAVPNYGSYFVQWGSALSGTNSPVDFAVVSTNPVRAVFATLQPGQVALSVRIIGAGSVNVTPHQQVYAVGDHVTLTATAQDTATQFNGWSGDAESETNSLVLTLDTSKVVNANFSPVEIRLHITQQDSMVQLSWPASLFYYSLQTATSLLPASVWTAPGFGTQTTVGNMVFITVPATNAQQFFRLRRATIPIFQFAIFYNGLLEFSTAATMTVRGRVHANGSIYTGSGSPLTFMDTVTTAGTISSPANGGGTPPWSYTGNYLGDPQSITNTPTLRPLVGTNNLHAIIDIPPADEDVTSPLGQQRYYNKAHVVMLVSNDTVTAMIKNDPTDTPITINVITFGTNSASLRTNFPFLSITNRFNERREGTKTNFLTQININLYNRWLLTNSSIATKFATSGKYPNIAYVADNRTPSSTVLYSVRLTNGVAIPTNGTTGFTLATPNPLYVWDNYNCPISANLGTTNTAGTQPASFACDAFTVLSRNWSDSASYGSYGSQANAISTTVNACMITGVVPSTGITTSTFSGGVHNLPRLLENWSSSGVTLTLNTSIVCLFNSTVATNKFIWPGTTYNPPSRNFNFDNRLTSATRLPPGTPVVGVSDN